MLNFAKVLDKAPPIYVYKPEEANGCGGPELVLVDASERGRCPYNCALGVINGNGTKDNPYHISGNSSVSYHYQIVCLWHKYWARSEKEQIYIRVNGWVLLLTSEGVIASDRKFTRLI